MLVAYERGTIVHDRFRLERAIGDGGSARVFLAKDLRTAHSVALKVARLPGEAAADLAREAEVLRAVRHPRVAGFVTSGVLRDHRSFLATRYVPGHSLRHILTSSKTDVSDALGLCCTLADALAAVHAAGYIHRDVKPDNIVVPIRDSLPSFREATLVDFGVSGVLSERVSKGDTQKQTRWGRVSGTVWYMAPEQLAGRAQTVATDVYSLGLLLYEAVFGTVPQSGEEARAIRNRTGGALLAYTGAFVRRRITEEVILPDRPHLSAALRCFIQALLAPDPADRIACMPDVLLCLDALHASQSTR
jgi:serine/threonine protein kinase